MDNPVKVSTHQPRNPLSRLGHYRLKRAAKCRDEAIQAAHDRYAHEVSAIFAQDRASAFALHNNELTAPSIADPFSTALDHITSTKWFVDLRELARKVRRG
jgi:hypothetical protein